MNKQIEKLVGKAWEQANKETSEDDWYTWVHDEIFQTKLVELVVKECVDIIQLESDNAIRNNTYMGDDVPASVTQVTIKKHFGVER
jgi:nucleoside diphosphate kinase